jgi:hypothetical protein
MSDHRPLGCLNVHPLHCEILDLAFEVEELAKGCLARRWRREVPRTRPE